MKKTKIKWLSAPQKHDYPAARTYLNLILQPRDAKKIVDKIKRASVQEFAAKDIFRAANVPLLSTTDNDVKKDRGLILHKKALSPLLLYRDPTLSKLIIADGYHRLCAVYSFDEQAMIPCQIV
jgi:disulfide oxidoreductase YuzD